MVGVALAILGVFVFTATPAAATCGEYVHLGDQTVAPATDHHSAPAPPCHGPNCSQHRPTPSAPLSAPVTMPSHEKVGAAGLDAIVPFPAALAWLLTSEPDGRTVHATDPIFHPPRD